jgi:chemotaxis protein histidine kinase CheA
MQEFSSVTASSYDAASLTPLLNEKAAEGWSIVSIVSAGTNIVAYLSRETDELDMVEEAAAEVAVEEAIVEEAAAEVAAEEAVVEAAAIEVAAEEAAVEEAAAEVAAEATAEPAGWATEPATDSTAPADDSIAGLAAQVGAADAAADATTTTEPAAEPTLAAAAPAPAPAPAAEPAVPAGWYADPSGRFELRYWDGAAWTEHVSRAGQQFTDPPVA